MIIKALRPFLGFYSVREYIDSLESKQKQNKQKPAEVELKLADH